MLLEKIHKILHILFKRNEPNRAQQEGASSAPPRGHERSFPWRRAARFLAAGSQVRAPGVAPAGPGSFPTPELQEGLRWAQEGTRSSDPGARFLGGDHPRPLTRAPPAPRAHRARSPVRAAPQPPGLRLQARGQARRLGGAAPRPRPRMTWGDRRPIGGGSCAAGTPAPRDWPRASPHPLS